MYPILSYLKIYPLWNSQQIMAPPVMKELDTNYPSNL